MAWLASSLARANELISAWQVFKALSKKALTLEGIYPLWRVGLFWCALRGRPWGVGGVWGLVVGGLGPSEGPCVGPYALSLRLKRERRGPKMSKSENHRFHILNLRFTWFSGSPVNKQYIPDMCAKESALAATPLQCKQHHKVSTHSDFLGLRCPPNAPSFTSCGSYDCIWSQ